MPTLEEWQNSVKGLRRHLIVKYGGAAAVSDAPEPLTDYMDVSKPRATRGNDGVNDSNCIGSILRQFKPC